MTEPGDVVLLAGLVLETTAGDASTVHQHLPGHHVLQAFDVVPTDTACAGLCWLGLVKVGLLPSFPSNHCTEPAKSPDDVETQ
jgi:hypothetical protein